jgi:hypothetical protein
MPDLTFGRQTLLRRGAFSRLLLEDSNNATPEEGLAFLQEIEELDSKDCDRV